MGKNTTTIPRTVAARILYDAGAKRVGDDAAEELVEAMEKKAASISKKAAELAKHAGRKTIMKEDIRLASSNE